jgi:hypothetical protein
MIFLCFVDRASRYNSGKRPTWRKILISVCLFHFSTCFEQPSAHRQKNQLYQYNVWYMSLYVGDRLVCRSGRNEEESPNDVSDHQDLFTHMYLLQHFKVHYCFTYNLLCIKTLHVFPRSLIMCFMWFSKQIIAAVLNAIYGRVSCSLGTTSLKM